MIYNYITSVLLLALSWLPITKYLEMIDVTAVYFKMFKWISPPKRMHLAGLMFVHALSFLQEVVTRGTNIIFGTLYRGRSRPLPPISNPLLLESAESLAQMIRKRKVSSEEVVQAYISRIQEVNPIINAMVDQRFDDAIREARAVDHLLATTNKTEKDLEQEKPFLGVPYTIKENFQVKGLRQTIGLVPRRNHISVSDADVVTIMRRAGAVLLGVTNLSELCTWWESRNNVYGQTNNPYDTTRVAGGSSGGEGSLLGAAGTVVGIGSDIGGSIRMPAFFNGIFGHKPSPGIVSNKGQLPLAEGETAEYLSTGPMCRYAGDLLPVYRLLAGANADKAKLNVPVNIKNIKLYYMEDDGGFPLVSSVSKELRTIQRKVLKYFQRAHGIQARKVCFPAMARSLELWAGKMCNGGVPSFSEELTERKGKVNIYTEFLKWCVGKSEHTFPAIAIGFLEKVDVGHDKEDYAEIVSVCKKLKSDFQRVLGEDGIFLYPSFPVVAPFHYQPLLMPFNFAYPAIFNILALPVTQCPLGLGEEGVPLGIQVVASPYNDHLCLAMACELERAFGGWVSPSDIV